MQLTEIVDSIAGRFGRELDFVFKRQIETSVIHSRSEIIRRDIEKKSKISPNYIQQINCIQTIEVDIAECCNVTIGCNVLRSCDPIPLPIRNCITDAPYMYVGTIDNSRGFVYRNPEDVQFLIEDRFIRQSGTVFYAYINQYIYIFNNKSQIKNIRVRGVFSDLRSIAVLNDCDGFNGACVDLEISTDLVNLIKDLVYDEFRTADREVEDKEIQMVDKHRMISLKAVVRKLSTKEAYIL